MDKKTTFASPVFTPKPRASIKQALSVCGLSLFLASCGGGSEDTSGSPGDSKLASSTVTQDMSPSGVPNNLTQAQLREKGVAELTALAAKSKWTAPIATSIVPISGANLADGRILMWSSEDRFGFGTDTGQTYTLMYNPATGQLTERLANESGHDMFCPGTSLLPDGRLLVNGGLSSGKTSLYNPSTNTWSAAPAMNIPRAYNASTPLADGSVLTLGGSWAGGVGNKHGERFTVASGWQRLSGVPIDPMLSVDSTRNFGMDSHLWLIPSGNGRVLHAGPGVAMNWIDTRGNGQVTPAGTRTTDEFSISGNTVMYDTGKVLKTGGAPGYDSVNSNSNSLVIDTTSGTAQARRIGSMAYARAFHNSVVLPNGQVIIMGGMTYAVGFSDANSVLVPELFDPISEAFVTLPAMASPRNYHSFALLLADGRVLSGGGGLCGAGCAANHADFQILSPPYLFNSDGTAATRPLIQSAPRTAAHGTTISVTTDSPVASAALVRLSSTTHTVNNDQRRLSLDMRSNGSNTYSVDIPSNAGWAVPGEYMLFVMNANGTPSVSKTIQIGPSNGLWLTPPNDLFATVGTPFSQTLSATASSGSIAYSAANLPSGLGLNASNGQITGTALQAGTYLVTLTASNGTGQASWQVPFTVRDPGGVRYVKLEGLSEVAANPWASMAEFELLDDAGRVLPRTGWTASADSAEIAGENGAAANAIDGNLATIWHTQWQAASPAYPHSFIVNLGSAQSIGGFRYTPRSGGGNGTIATYRFYVSTDGVNWGSPISSGDFRLLGANADVKTVYLGNLALGKNASQSSSFTAGSGAALAVDGNPDGVFNNGSVSSTNNEANAWWEVDLGSAQTLHTVRLWNRADGVEARLTDFYALLSPTPMAGRTLPVLLADSSVTSVRTTGIAGRPSTLALAGTGRYLRIQLAGTNFLNIAEVEAFGTSAVNRPPALVTPGAQSSNVGAAVSFQMQGSDPDRDALSWSATGLPSGLAINASTGLISGTASASGGFNVQISVSDGRGGTANTSFTWTITAASLSVSPVAAPAVVSGTTASYTASATGVGLQYSWNFGDGSATSALVSNPSATHVYSANGIYTVTLSVRDAAGTVTSRSFSQAVVGSSVNGQAFASSALAIEARSGASNRVWVANPDSDTVSVFDAANFAKLAEIAVGAQPRSVAVAPSGRIWVLSKAAASLSLIDPASLAIIQTVALPRGSLPYGLLIAPDGNAYIALEGTGRVQKISAAGAVLADVTVPGARHVALSRDGTRLLVSRFITAPQPGEASAAVSSSLNGLATGGEVIELDPGTLSQRRNFVLQHSTKPDTTVSGRGVPNYLGAAAIAPDGSAAWIPSKQDNIARGVLRDGQNLDFQNTVRAISSRLNLSTQTEDLAGRVDHDNSGLASAAAYHPNGAYVFVALETSRQVAVLDAAGRRELFTIEAGRAPQAVAVSADGRRLYVSNFMDRSLGIYDLGPLVDFGDNRIPLLNAPKTIATEKLAASVLVGKQLFYDARDTRLARDAYMSCASCHNDGGHDGRTWDLTGFGEGLRNTISLRGRSATGHGFMHWSANFDELQDFEGQIRNLAAGTGLMSDAQFNTGTRSQPLGDKKAGLSTDLDALASYVASLTSFGPSPYRPSSAALSANGQTGQKLFQSLNCASCHTGTAFTASADAGALKNIGTLKASSGNRLNTALPGIDIPTLRDVWSSAPYLHDGSAPSLVDAINAHKNMSLSAADAASLATYLNELGADEPAAVVTPTPSGTSCAVEGGTCSVPVGQTATVYYGANGSYLQRTGVTGSLSCSAANFGDPAVGATKACFYVLNGAPGNTGTGLLGQYFGNVNLSGSVLLARNEAPNFDWVNAAPANALPADNFSVRWSGMIEAPSSGTATLQLVADDGVRMWFDNKLVIDDWTPHAATAFNATVTLTAGKRYPITIEYYEAGGQASAKLNWALPGSSAYSAVPLTRLYAAATPSSINLALGKVATQSSTYSTAVASRAIDGNLNGTYSAGSVTHTNGGAQDWWQLDLGAIKKIDLVQLWNRTDCCTTRLQNFAVFASSTDMAGKTYSQLLADPNVTVRQVGASKLTSTMGLPINANARYVRVQLSGTNYLSLAEVQVFGTP